MKVRVALPSLSLGTSARVIVPHCSVARVKVLVPVAPALVISSSATTTRVPVAPVVVEGILENHPLPDLFPYQSILLLLKVLHLQSVL